METSDQGPVVTYKDVMTRWPGIAELDVAEAADFLRHCYANDVNELSQQLYETDSDDSTLELVRTLVRRSHWETISLDGSERFLRENAAQEIYLHESHEAVDAIESGDTELADGTVHKLLSRWPHGLRVTYTESPLFPEGREILIPVDLAAGQTIDGPRGSEYVANCCGVEQEVRKEIVDFINRPKEDEFSQDLEAIHQIVNDSSIIDRPYYEDLRTTYGTKAANLFIFAEASSNFAQLAHDTDQGFVTDPKVPRFTVAPTMLYKLYRDSDERYQDYLEQIRQQAVTISDDQYDPEAFRPLVAIRSSAVFSEDGEEASGAGIYESVAADPRDVVAFREAVEKVFASAQSDKAKAYLASKDIDNELMGLVIQQYVEGGSSKDYAFGYIRSSDASGRLIELSSNHGELLFDRAKVSDTLMTDHTLNRHDLVVSALHTVPDHDSDISKFTQQGSETAHAALFAEKMFGKQVELEFIFGGSHRVNVVQVRPIPNQELQSPEVQFPTDIEPLAVCRATGAGDVIVTIRDNSNYLENEIELDWAETEHQAGMHSYSRNPNAVLVIGYNDGRSGHLQMQARERGQICLYPEPLTRLPNTLNEYLYYDRHNPDRVRQLRIVSDGYKGAIYPIEAE